jgi:hypothetical protein
MVRSQKLIENLNVAGGGWRMPTRAELKTLYKEGAGSHNMTPLLKTTGWFVWSGETKGSSSACALFFRVGFEYWGYPDTSRYGTRFCGALPKMVRFPKIMIDYLDI